MWCFGDEYGRDDAFGLRIRIARLGPRPIALQVGFEEPRFGLINTSIVHIETRPHAIGNANVFRFTRLLRATIRIGLALTIGLAFGFCDTQSRKTNVALQRTDMRCIASFTV